MNLITALSIAHTSTTTICGLALALAVLMIGMLWRRRYTQPGAAEFGRVTVTPENITPDMHVPSLDSSAHFGDCQLGSVAGTLFTQAVISCALTAPDGVRIACIPDNDIETGGFALIAFPDEEIATWGATTGYHQANVIGTQDPHRTADKALVVAALNLFARELNIALSGIEERAPRKTGLLAKLASREPGPLQIGHYLKLVSDDVRVWVDLILAQAAVAPEEEIPGLVSALECILSVDDRDAGQLVERVRAAVEQ